MMLLPVPLLRWQLGAAAAAVMDMGPRRRRSSGCCWLVLRRGLEQQRRQQGVVLHPVLVSTGEVSEGWWDALLVCTHAGRVVWSGLRFLDESWAMLCLQDDA
jgi:hypothetical protein